MSIVVPMAVVDLSVALHCRIFLLSIPAMYFVSASTRVRTMICKWPPKNVNGYHSFQFGLGDCWRVEIGVRDVNHPLGKLKEEGEHWLTLCIF